MVLSLQYQNSTPTTNWSGTVHILCMNIGSVCDTTTVPCYCSTRWYQTLLWDRQTTQAIIYKLSAAVLAP